MSPKVESSKSPRRADNGTERARAGRAMLVPKETYTSVKRGLYFLAVAINKSLGLPLGINSKAELCHGNDLPIIFSVPFRLSV